MAIIIRMPLINVNDQSVQLQNFFVSDGAFVKKGDVIFVVETSKSVVDVEAEEDGYFWSIVEPSKSYSVGKAVAVLTTTPTPPPEEMIKDTALQNDESSNSDALSKSRSTIKAKILADKFGLDIEDIFEQNNGTIVTEEMVKASLKNRNISVKTDIVSKILKNSENIRKEERDEVERIIILGAGGGAALALDIISRNKNQVAIGILDNDPRKHGLVIMGVTCLGGFELTEELWKNNIFDALISTVVRDAVERGMVYDSFCNIGIPFTNVIDHDVRLGVENSIGSGNLITYGSYLATHSKIGNNNFLAAGVVVEHHCVIGDHCTFGPRTTLAGSVIVGDYVKTGMLVGIEPEVKIGNGSVIASGVVVTSNVFSNTTLKTSVSILRR